MKNLSILIEESYIKNYIKSVGSGAVFGGILGSTLGGLVGGILGSGADTMHSLISSDSLSSSDYFSTGLQLGSAVGGGLGFLTGAQIGAYHLLDQNKKIKTKEKSWLKQK